ncbi:hypothetical protein GIY56_15395 [Paracoccus sp. YIM 132242]|uniref:Uncharacterized protein n=1 Tax=Paracoccus lichenicola TaxID=2665644 RepID=A0A6L6HTY4_9RHOB|nr:hypothetical protein [Paracoccus lichenicola]MTE01673.1 hypothetical protein [Paracoccus lichenicola]
MEIELIAKTNLFHAGQEGFIFDNARTLWVAEQREVATNYKDFDIQIGYPERLMYELSLIRDIKLAVFPDFGNNFCFHFCNADHNCYARTLTAWANERTALDEVSPLDGIVDGRDRLLFRAGDVCEIKKVTIIR